MQACTQDSNPLISLVLFGSAARGSFTRQLSDVDLIVVVSDTASHQQHTKVRDEISRQEIAHGFRQSASPSNRLQALAERTCGENHSCFVCTRNDLLSAEVARVLGLKPVEALFVDRIVFANIIASAVTVWGEDLQPLVRPPAVRHLDVFQAWFAFSNQVVLSLLAYPFLPDATRYAMATLKHSLHSCYFCYHLQTTALDEEIAFFQHRLGNIETLERLLTLRQQYRKSFAFVLRCLPTLARLHLRTALDNSFPLRPRH